VLSLTSSRTASLRRYHPPHALRKRDDLAQNFGVVPGDLASAMTSFCCSSSLSFLLPALDPLYELAKFRLLVHDTFITDGVCGFGIGSNCRSIWASYV